jgi:hypothetical protein
MLWLGLACQCMRRQQRRLFLYYIVTTITITMAITSTLHSVTTNTIVAKIMIIVITAKTDKTKMRRSNQLQQLKHCSRLPGSFTTSFITVTDMRLQKTS